MSERWDRHFLRLALDHARMSKDPSTMVGAVIVGPDREVRSAGFNGFPRGIADTEERLNNRALKLSLTVHAEMNAVLAAARVGIPVRGCTLFVTAADHDGHVWGGPPCTRCTVEVIQAGISEVIAYSSAAIPDRWKADIEAARLLLIEAGIAYREVQP